jgi:tRNA threonylcarbamoyladenosine biosynthesis protein TsaB
MTLVLGIDTSTPIASVAVVRDDVTLALTHQRTRGSDLLVMIDAACAGAAIAPHELDAVAIGAGPGSFTGLRIGMATAKGIAFAAKRPLWAVSSLAALARGELFANSADVTTVCAVLDARRGELYAGIFAREGDALVAVGDERVLAPADLAAFAAGAPCIGDAGAAYPDLPGTWDRTPSGADVARLALAGARADVLVAGAPAYLRKAEAEIMYPDGVPGALRER